MILFVKRHIKNLIPFLILALTFSFQTSFAAAPEKEDYIIKFADDVDLDQEISNLSQSKITATRVFRNVYKGGVFSMTSAQANALLRNPKIELLEKDQIVSIAGIVTQPTSRTDNGLWGLDRIDDPLSPRSDGTYQYEFTSGATTYGAGVGVTAYVIDTGILISHTQFEGRARWGTNTAGGSDRDCNGHGTHVAGTIGGKDFGVAKKVTLVAVKVLNCAGSGTWSGIIAGIDWVVNHHAQNVRAVANLSLGGGKSATVNLAVTRMVDDNIVVAVAAGNENIDASNTSPASAVGVITVGASDSSDRRAAFSNFGSTLEVFAPGVNILSAYVSGSSTTATARLQGTSMASPHVAGAAARILSSNGFCSNLNTCASDARTQLLRQSTSNAISNEGTNSPKSLLYVNPNQ